MKQKVQTPYGTATVYIQQGDETDTCVAVIPGYSESIAHTKELVEALADLRHTTLTFTQPRKKAAPDPLRRQADIIQGILASVVPANKKIYAVAHSLGSTSILKVVQENPERFTGVILMQPPGLFDKPTFFKLVRRVARKSRKNHTSALKNIFPRKGGGTDEATKTVSLRKVFRAQLSSGKLIARNPSLALKEAQAAIEHTIADDIARVEKLGIPVNVIWANSDELFSIHEDGWHAQLLKLPGSYSSINDKNAGHDTFWMQPKRTACIIDSLIKHTPIATPYSTDHVAIDRQL